MKTLIPVLHPLVLVLLALCHFTTSTQAQTVSIPDPGLNAAIRDALGKLTGLLNAQDLLSLTNLVARLRKISSLQGLESASNLVSLDLKSNRLNSFPLLTQLMFHGKSFSGPVSLPNRLNL
jgi:hypothetical protein